jgi:hypothetical protein|tara:strand:- start:337 stop:825 length:489 start_codon:yes stop_codon:yes gene_type:complete
MFFLEQLQHVIDKVKDNATKSTLQKAHTILVAIDALSPINDMIEEWYQSRPAGPLPAPSIDSYQKLQMQMDMYRSELERLGWLHCPETTPPNFNGERGWMHPFYCQRGHHHILYISNDVNDIGYVDVTLYQDNEMKYHENTSVGALMDWMDGALGENHADHD